jgi:two-component system response regulator YesN
MIVDDEPNTLEKLANYIHLADLDFHVGAKALGAEDALYFLGITSPDLVITDIRMPVMDGLALLQRMRQNGWNGYAAIITGHDDFAYAQQAIRLNVFEFIIKPVFPEDIAALLSRARLLLDRDQTEKEKLRNEIQAELKGSSPTDDVNGSLPSYIGQAKAYIKEHYAEPLTLNQVAKNVAISPVYLSSRFAKYCGQNFLEYITKYRITKAKELLAQTNLQVQEVANKVGYTDIAYFSRVFRRESGQTPSNYRSQCQK